MTRHGLLNRASVLVLSMAALTCTPGGAQAAVTPDQREAAVKLLEAMDLRTVLQETIDKALEQQIMANPQIAPFRATLQSFLNTYMSWDALKDDMADIYAEEFTVDELKELTSFYQTPLGKKLVRKLPTLTAKGMALGQSRVQEHLPELKQQIEDQVRSRQQQK